MRCFLPKVIFVFSAVSALRELTLMSDSIQSLAEMIERNPQALIMGKVKADE